MKTSNSSFNPKRYIIYLFFCCGFFLFFNNVNAQKRKRIDSLQNLLQFAKVDTTKALLMSLLSYEYLNVNQDSSREFLQKGISLSQEINFPKAQAVGFYCLSNLFLRNDRIDSAILLSNKSLEICRRINYPTFIDRNYFHLGSCYLRMDQYTTAMDYYLKSLKIREQANDKRGLSSVYQGIGSILLRQKKYDDALNFYNKALKINIEINIKLNIANLYHNIGNIYAEQNKNELALEYFNKSIEICKVIDNKKGLVSSYSNIGLLYQKLQNIDKALEYNFLAIELGKKINDKYFLCDAYCNVGEIYFALSQFAKSIDYSKTGLQLAQQIHSLTSIKSAAQTLYQIYKKQKQYAVALEYHEIAKAANDSVYSTEKSKKIDDLKYSYEIDKKQKEIDIAQKNKQLAEQENKQMFLVTSMFAVGFISLLLLIIVVLLNRSKLKRALNIVTMQKAEISEKNEELRILNEQISTQRDDIEEAYGNVKQISEIGKEITNNLNIKEIVKTVHNQVNTLMNAYSFVIGIFNENSKQIEIYGVENSELLPYKFYNVLDTNQLAVICFTQKKEIVINNFNFEYQNYLSTEFFQPRSTPKLSIIYLPLIQNDTVLGVISVQSPKTDAYSNYHVFMLRNIAIYSAIALSNGMAFTKIEEQKRQIELSHQQITDSIVYAERIQAAVLPPFSFISMILPNHFILFKPRDIVSGDFYFIKQVKQFTLFAVVDCTGHGVPGAFMSMLGVTILNELVFDSEIEGSNILLNALRNQVKNSLQQTGQFGEAQDGMDIAFCAINLENMEMSYAGAFNPCWIFRKIENENNSQLIELPADRQPVGVYSKEKPFTEHKIQLLQGDTIYLFSDGYYSQFGGEKHETLKIRRFREYLIQMNQLPMSEQQMVLENKFNEWKGDEPQTDDVLVMGVRI